MDRLCTAQVSTIASLISERGRQLRLARHLRKPLGALLAAHVPEGSPGLNQSEFLVAYITECELVDPSELAEMARSFHRLDADRNGRLDRHDLAKARARPAQRLRTRPEPEPGVARTAHGMTAAARRPSQASWPDKPRPLWLSRSPTQIALEEVGLSKSSKRLFDQHEAGSGGAAGVV